MLSIFFLRKHIFLLTYYNLLCYNIQTKRDENCVKIIKTSKYKRDLQKNIKNKHMKKEEETIEAIEELMIQSTNMKELLLNPLSIVYNIEKKKGDLKEIYTARINRKIRMYIKPVGEYPYKLEEIVEIELKEIDNNHYGEG